MLNLKYKVRDGPLERRMILTYVISNTVFIGAVFTLPTTLVSEDATKDVIIVSLKGLSYRYNIG
jgi:hypothetical protein